MAFTNFDTKEINCKVLYMGARHAGKTENLRTIFRETSEELKADLIVFDEKRVPSNPVFEFLPIDLGVVKDFQFKLHLFTLPNHGLYESLEFTILKGIDGVVFVADSSEDRMVENLAALKRLKALCSKHNYSFQSLPKVFQYNKRDLPVAVKTQVMKQEINPFSAPDFESIATTGQGVLPTLESIAGQIVDKFARGAY